MAMDTTDSVTWLDGLNRAWLVVAQDGAALARISPVHAEGLVAPLYTARDAAEEAARDAAGDRRFAAHPAPSLWQVAQLLAEQGFAGLLLDDQIPLFFLADQPDAALPTHLAIPQEETFLIVGADGPTSLQPQDLHPWSDTERFDRLAIAWLLGPQMPFLSYEEGMALVEYVPGGEPQVTEDLGLLLPVSGAQRSALPLFSTPYGAEWYWENMVSAPLTGEGEWAEQIVAHADVPGMLAARARALPDAALVLNPGRHRFYQGFFRQADGVWYLVTINGVWLVEAPFRCTQVARRR